MKLKESKEIINNLGDNAMECTVNHKKKISEKETIKIVGNVCEMNIKEFQKIADKFMKEDACPIKYYQIVMSVIANLTVQVIPELAELMHSDKEEVTIMLIKEISKKLNVKVIDGTPYLEAVMGKSISTVN